MELLLFCDLELSWPYHQRDFWLLELPYMINMYAVGGHLAGSVTAQFAWHAAVLLSFSPSFTIPCVLPDEDVVCRHGLVP